MEKYKAVKITGINGFEFIVGFESIWHDDAIKSKELGVKAEIIYTNISYHSLVFWKIHKVLSELEIIEGTINKEKLANSNQVWNLANLIRNEVKHCSQPTNTNRNDCA